MPDWLPALIFGGVLIGLAAGLGVYQQSVWKLAVAGLADEDDARQQATRQFRRRLQVSGLLALIGLMIPVGDILPNLRKAPGLFAVYWLLVLGLVAWMVLLALGDLASNLAQHRTARARLEVERRSIEQQLRRHREAKTERKS